MRAIPPEDDSDLTSLGRTSGGPAADPAMPIPENVAGALAYLTFVPPILFLLVGPYNRNFFVRFHSLQNLLLWAAGVIICIAFWIVAAVVLFVPFIRILVVPFVALLLLAAITLWLLLVIKAYQGVAFKLPIIGDMAENWANA
jgi:uncharacterized membrane protein